MKKERSLEKLHKDMEKKLLETNIESIQVRLLLTIYKVKKVT